MNLCGRLGAAAMAIGAAMIAWTSPVMAESAAVSAVWEREGEYWRDVKAGDAKHYVTLWHEQFVGWPCGEAHPLGKSAIGGWIAALRDKHVAVDVQLTHEGAQAFDDVVVVHYSFTRVDTYPDGHVEGRGERRKITHTWKKAGNTWLIIGGMCGPIEPDAATKPH